MPSAVFFCICCRLCKQYSFFCHIKPVTEVDILSPLGLWNFVCIVVCKWTSEWSKMHTSCVIFSQASRHASLAKHVQLSGILSIWMGTDSCHSSKIRQKPLLLSACRSFFAPAVSVNSSGLWHSSFMFSSFLLYCHVLCWLTPGGSSTVHIYTQTIHRTIQWNRIYWTEHT